MATTELVPKPARGIELLELPGGGAALYLPDETYLQIGLDQARAFRQMDGTTSLSEIVMRGSAHGSLLSVRAVLGLVASLAGRGLLENAPEELRHAGVSMAPSRSAGVVAKLFTGGVSSRALGRLIDRIVPGGVLPLPAAASATLTALSLIVAAVLFWRGAEGSDNPLLLGGRYTFGLLVVYGGAWVAMAVRADARTLALRGEGCSVHAAGLHLRLLPLMPLVDTRHALRAGRRGRARVELAGIAGATMVLAIAMIGSSVLAGEVGRQACSLLALGAGLSCLVISCPLFASDLGRALALMAPWENNAGHTHSYLSRRYLRTLLQTRLFNGEAYLIGTLIGMVVWLMTAFWSAARLLAHDLLPAMTGALMHDDLVDEVVVGSLGVVLLLGTATLALGLVASVVRMLINLLPATKPRAKAANPSAVDVRASLSSHALFSRFQGDTIERIAATTEALRFEAGQDIVRQGDDGDSMYLIASGEAEVVITADSGLDTSVATLQGGDCFGEVALLEHMPRTATVRAAGGAVIVLRVAQGNFATAVDEAGMSSAEVTALIGALHTVQTSPVLHSLSPNARNRLLAGFVRTEVGAGETLIREGDAGESFYVLESGSALVTKGDNNHPEATLAPGDFFGEIALLTDSPRTATVTTTAPSTLLTIDRDTFRNVVSHDLGLGALIEEIAERRQMG